MPTATIDAMAQLSAIDAAHQAGVPLATIIEAAFNGRIEMVRPRRGERLMVTAESFSQWLEGRSG